MMLSTIGVPTEKYNTPYWGVCHVDARSLGHFPNSMASISQWKNLRQRAFDQRILRSAFARH
jgi:hypothetical protein